MYIFVFLFYVLSYFPWLQLFLPGVEGEVLLVVGMSFPLDVNVFLA